MVAPFLLATAILGSLATSAHVTGQDSYRDELKALPFNVERSAIKGIDKSHLADGLVILVDENNKPIYEMPIQTPDAIQEKNVALLGHWLVVGSGKTLYVAKLPIYPTSGEIPNLFPDDESLIGIEDWLPSPQFIDKKNLKELEDARNKIKDRNQRGEYVGQSEMKSDRRIFADLFIRYLNIDCVNNTPVVPVTGIGFRQGRPSVQERNYIDSYNKSKSPQLAKVLRVLTVRNWLWSELSLDFKKPVVRLFPTLSPNPDYPFPEVNDLIRRGLLEPVFRGLDILRDLPYRAYSVVLQGGSFEKGSGIRLYSDLGLSANVQRRFNRADV